MDFLNYSYTFLVNHRNFLLLFLIITLIFLAYFQSLKATSKESSSCSSLLNTFVKTIDGDEMSLCHYHGKVILIVNTASHCGFTKQYAELEAIYEKYKNEGFEILAFPSNDFANQEPGNEDQIKKFCASNFNVSFPIHAKSHVKGKNQIELYQKLSAAKGDVQWNFQKYLINRKGQVVKKFAPWTSPLSDSIQVPIQEELKKQF